MKSFIIVGLLFLIIQKVTGGVITNSGQLAAITCITSQNLQSYSEKIAVFLTQNKAPVDDVKLNKFMKCYWTSKGLLNQNGNIDADNLRIYLENIFANGGKITTTHQEVAKSAVDHCKDSRVKNPGQKAIIVQNCITAFLMDQEETLMS